MNPNPLSVSRLIEPFTFAIVASLIVVSKRLALGSEPRQRIDDLEDLSVRGGFQKTCRSD
jgi:hypothetical protein